MNIGVTGCSSAIGTRVCQLVKHAGHNLVAIGRNEEVFWQFGQRLPSTDIQALIHIAHDRNASPIEALQNNELVLSSLPKNTFVVYLSSTSAHANTLSDYGRSKYLCESLFFNANFAIVKSGLIFDPCSKKQTGVLGTLESLAGKLPIIPIPFGGKPTLYMSDIDALSSTIVNLSINRLAGKYAAFSPKAISLFELIYQLSQSSNRSSKLLLLPDLPTRSIATSLSKFRHRFGTLDSLLSLVHEITDDEIQTLMVPDVIFPNY